MSLAHRVAARVLLSSSALTVTGGKREQYRDQVWEMYLKSYAQIKMHLSGPEELMDYGLWELFLDSADQPHAFACLSMTPHGFKGGVCGSDGTGEGKSAIKGYLRSAYNRSGYYSEVSHAVEHLTSSAPKVCAVDAGKVLKKPIVPSEDGLHYTRSIKSVGLVEKVMVGHPKGVGSSTTPKCAPVEKTAEEKAAQEKLAAEEKEARFDAAEHHSHQQDFGDLDE